MTHCHHEDHGDSRDQGDVARAAEEFARRVARDASRFGERLAEHAGEFGRNLAREWRGHRRSGTPWSGDDVRGVLREVRGMLSDLVDGVDELVERMFGSSPATWVRVVSSREVTCAGCSRVIGAGEECHVRKAVDGRIFRCLTCGPGPSDAAPNAGSSDPGR
jgi:hypothetical protein